MAEKPTLDELAEQGGRRLAAEFDKPYDSQADGYDRTHWDALARAVLEAAGVPALLERAETAEREEGKTLQAAWDSLGDMLERAESAEARVAQLEEALREWLHAREPYGHWPARVTMSQALERVQNAEAAARAALAG